MGKSYTPKYVVVIDGREHQSMAWDSRQNGKPTPRNLERWILAYGKSLELGQCNAHISEALGYIPYPSRACIRANFPGSAPAAVWAAGQFQVW